MSSNSGVTTSGSETASRFIGRVKWFNNKAGYGFITVTDGSHSGKDIFVHHTALGVSGEQYKYLVQGEYVEFSIQELVGNAHTTQACDVSGIKGGKLMCETRHEFKIARTSHKESGDVKPAVNRSPVKQRRPPRASNDNKEWTLAKKPARAPRTKNEK